MRLNMNMFNYMAQFKKFAKDPIGALSSRFKLPDNIKTTDDAWNYLANSDQIPQDVRNQMGNFMS